MAGIQGTNIVAPVVPLDTADVHPTHEALYGKGGYRTVATTVERDAIPAARREEGMLVHVAADSTAYRLGADLTTWTVFNTGGGGSSAWADITGKPSTFAPSAHTHGNITDDGKLGSASGRLVMTSTAGVVVAAAQDAAITTRQLALASGYSGIAPIVFPDASEQSTAWTGTVAAGSVTGLGGAATLNVGTGAGTVAAGDDSRLSDARTPTSHVHGNINNAGAIGTTPGQIVVTTTSGVLTTAATIASSAVTGLGGAAVLNVGTTAGTVAAGNDSRLSDTRTPTDGSVTTAKIADGAVTDAKIADVAASKLTGTIADARLSQSVQNTENVYTWASFR